MGAGLTQPESVHEHCAPGGQCAIVAGFLGPHAENPANGWGSTHEAAAYATITSWDLRAARHPLPGFIDADDTRVTPDIGIDVAVPGTRSHPCGNAGTFSVFVEVKAQESDGSAKEKMEHTIRSYAALSDATGTVSLIGHLMCPKVVGEGFMELMSQLAERENVGFFDLAAATRDSLLAEAARIATKRQAVLGADALREVIADLGVENLAAALRLAMRTTTTSEDPTSVLDLFTAAHRDNNPEVTTAGAPAPALSISGTQLLSSLLG